MLREVRCISLLALFLTQITADVKPEVKTKVKVNKCCEPYEIYVNRSCTHITLINETAWRPMFVALDGTTNVQVDYQ